MGFRLESKKYNWIYLVKLPFLFNPVCTVVTLAQKLAVGAAFVAWGWAEAELVDGTAACARAGEGWEKLSPFFAFFLFLSFVRRMGYSLGRFCTRRIEKEGVCSLRRELVKKASRVPYRLLEDRTFHELYRYLYDSIGDRIWVMAQHGGNMCQYLLRAAGTVLVLCLLDVRVGLGALFSLLPLVCLFVKNAAKLVEPSGEEKAFRRRADYLMEMALGQKEAWERSLFGFTDYVKEAWRQQCSSNSRKALEEIRVEYRERRRNGVLMHAVFLLLVLSLITLFAQGRITLGWLLCAVHLIYELDFNMLHGVYQSVFLLMECLIYLQRLTDYANLPESEGNNVLPCGEEAVFESLEFRRVSFRYPRTVQYVLKDLSFKLEAGRGYAFVGENGAGKTTIVKILTGLYDSYEGSILLNGRELREYAPERRKAMFAAVYQGSARYEDTIANNILMGDMRRLEEMPGKSAETGDPGRWAQMVRYAGQLGIREIAQALPEGFHTLAGREAAEGVELSAGQWQRIVLARLLMNPAPVRILDEPAASLDPVRESSLYEQFDSLNEGRTTLYITHRLGAVRRSDVIFVLEGGSVAEQGSHEKLLQKGGIYAKMYESQRSWYVK